MEYSCANRTYSCLSFLSSWATARGADVTIRTASAARRRLNRVMRDPHEGRKLSQSVAGCGSRSTPRYGGRCEGVCVGGLADLGRNAWKSQTRSKVADWRPSATLEQITRFPGWSSAPGYFFLSRVYFLYVVPVMSSFSVSSPSLLLTLAVPRADHFTSPVMFPVVPSMHVS